MDCKFDNFIIPSYGNRKSRSLSKRKKDLLSNYLPQVSLKDFDNLITLITNYKNINLEIGFGDGQFLIENAKSHPHDLFIGSELYINGITQVLSEIEKYHIDNIILFTDDARKLLLNCPNAFLDNIYLLFPDPWPKKKHFKRRIVNIELLDLISDKMKIDSNLYIATDHPCYAKSIFCSIKKTKSFHINYNNSITSSSFNKTEIMTKYQKKAMQSKQPINYFLLQKYK